MPDDLDLADGPRGPEHFERKVLESHYLRGVGEAIIVLDAKGNIRGWPNSCQLMFGYTEAEAIGLPISTIFTAEDLALHIDLFERDAATHNDMAEDDRWHVRKDGVRIWVTGTLSAVRTQAGEIFGFVKILRDRTDLRTKLERLEHDLNVSTVGAEHDRHFIQTVGHELRNPLGPLSMAVELLRRASASDQTLGIIERQIAALQRLADNLMDMERVGHGGMSLHVTRFDLRELLDGAMEDFRTQAEQKRVVWKAILQPTPILIDADRGRIGQVLVNLLSNALRYTPSGGTVVLKSGQEVDEAVIRVEDSGMGISAEHLPQMFRLFSRGPEAAGLVPGGLGVGLAVSREIVELHKGTIAVRSPGQGKGSEFTVRLPLRQADGEPG